MENFNKIAQLQIFASQKSVAQKLNIYPEVALEFNQALLPDLGIVLYYTVHM